MIELLSIRTRSMIGFYVMFTVGILHGLTGLVSNKPSPLLGIAAVLLLAMMFLGFSLHADARYKIVEVVDTMEKSNRTEGDRQRDMMDHV